MGVDVVAARRRSSGVAPTTTTSQASTPVPVGSTTSRAVPSVVPPAASAAVPAACSAVSVGVVPTVSPGKTRPRTPVTRSSSVLRRAAAAGEDERGVEDRHLAQRLGGPGGGDVGDGLGVGVVEAQGRGVHAEQRRAVLVHERRRGAGPGAAGELGEVAGDVVLAAGPAGVGLLAQPVDGVLERRRCGPRPRRPSWWLWTQVSETTSVTGSRSSSTPSIGVWQPVTTRPEQRHRRGRPPAAGRPRPGRRGRRLLIMVTRWSGPGRPEVNDPSGHGER